MLQQKFNTHIKLKNSITKDSKLVLGVSGGKDSMALAHLLLNSGYEFSVAHCNFCLRNEEANRDEDFVKQYFDKIGIRVFTIRFNTLSYAKEKGISIQMAARELRYNWFNELILNFKFDFVLTAHHLNDALETFFINLLRGTGINGLKGIPDKQGTIIRPLLFAKSDEINEFVSKNNIQYVEDSSNRETKYLRNKLRRQIIPLLKEINPALETVFSKELNIISQSNGYMQMKIQEDLKKIQNDIQGETMFLISELLCHPFKELLLHHIWEKYGFPSANLVQLIATLENRHSGKLFYSPKYACLVDRNYMVIKPIEQMASTEFTIFENEQFLDFPLRCEFKKVEGKIVTKESNCACIDYDKLQFPLKLRKWKTGDVFFPFGMNGSKKLSDYFINQKYTLFEKEQQWLLTSNDEIVWVIGKRLDKRFAVSDVTKTTLQIFNHGGPSTGF